MQREVNPVNASKDYVCMRGGIQHKHLREGFLSRGQLLVRVGERISAWWLLRSDWDAFGRIAKISGYDNTPQSLNEFYRNILALRGDFGVPRYIFYARVNARVRCYFGPGMDKMSNSKAERVAADKLIPQIFVPAHKDVFEAKAIVVETRLATGIDA